MQRDRLAAARLWLSNAETDLELAREIAGRYASRACFHAQQSAEMALKGLLIALADDHPRTDIGDGLVRELEALGEVVPPGIIAAANRLDLYYTGSRYPDALGGADPRKVLVSADALVAADRAAEVVAFAAAAIDRVAGSSEPGP